MAAPSKVKFGAVEFDVDAKGRLVGPNGPIKSKLPRWSTWLSDHPGYLPPVAPRVCGIGNNAKKPPAPELAK